MWPLQLLDLLEFSVLCGTYISLFFIQNTVKSLLIPGFRTKMKNFLVKYSGYYPILHKMSIVSYGLFNIILCR